MTFMTDFLPAALRAAQSAGI